MLFWMFQIYYFFKPNVVVGRFDLFGYMNYFDGVQNQFLGGTQKLDMTLPKPD